MATSHHVEITTHALPDTPASLARRSKPVCAARRSLRLALAWLLLAALTATAADAAPVRATFRDEFTFSLFNLVGIETQYLFTIDTELTLSNNVLSPGQTADFGYTQSYIMKSDFGRGTPELVPGNLFPTETAPVAGVDDVTSKHYEHDLFLTGCCEFLSAQATVLTNSPATGGLNSVTIGPVGVGGTAPAVGNTPYTFHVQPKQAWIDWIVAADRGGLFFEGGRISMSGTIISKSAPGTARLFTNNTMWLTAHSTLFPLYLMDDELLRTIGNVNHGIDIQCVPAPEPATLLLLGSGLVAMATGIRRRQHGRGPVRR